LLFIAYNTILVAYYTKIVAFEMTSFPTIIACRVRAVGFKITGLTAAVIKLKSFLKRIIGVYMTGGQTEIAF
jgi:hypothetical protein